MRRTVLLTAAALACVAGPAAAATLEQVTGPYLVSFLKTHGAEAELETDLSGEPLVLAEENASGLGFQISTYDCDGAVPPACATLLFRGVVIMDDAEELDVLRRVNEWNANRLFGRAFRNEDGNPELDMTVSLEGGVPEARLEVTLLQWLDAMNGFYEAMGR